MGHLSIMRKIPLPIQIILLIISVAFAISMILWLRNVSEQSTKLNAATQSASQDSYTLYKNQGNPTRDKTTVNTEVYGDDQIRKTIADVDKSITYAHLEKDPEKYNGMPWAASGKVIQIMEKGGQTTALVGADRYGAQNYWVSANFTTDFVKGNQVYIVGYLQGSYSYKSVAGWDITIPSLVARAILKPKDAAKFKGFSATTQRK